MQNDQHEHFFERVYAVARCIPYGKVTSYGAIARYLGTAGSARMVGWAMNQSHLLPDPVPAHRVVNRNGQLSGKQHFGGGEVMRNLLESEGVEVVDDAVLHFAEHFWDPASLG
ncbi:MAG TPA: MGMT family protein [Bacteroidales bacterium]|nr:MGMT family protein [Bacteroidales bacterium]HRZ77203.1 MGMT family protein [Bacteroidales bacterium]